MLMSLHHLHRLNTRKFSLYLREYTLKSDFGLTFFICVWKLILNVRKELLAYYVRHGYHDTHQTASYPLDTNVGQPLIHLHLVLMIKQI